MKKSINFKSLLTVLGWLLLLWVAVTAASGMRPAPPPLSPEQQAKAAAEKIKTASQNFAACEDEFERYHKMHIIDDVKLTLPFAFYAGRVFFQLSIQDKQTVAENFSCVLAKGSGVVDFDILNWRTGKPVGRFHYGRLEMN